MLKWGNIDLKSLVLKYRKIYKLKGLKEMFIWVNIGKKRGILKLRIGKIE